MAIQREQAFVLARPFGDARRGSHATSLLRRDAPRLETVRVLRIMFHNVTLPEVFTTIDQRITERKCGYIVTANVDHVCRYYTSPVFRKAYRHSCLVIPDGVPVMWASKLLGTPLREKISGSDLVVWLPTYLADRGHSLFLLGAAEGVADKAAQILRQRHPGLRIAGTYSPPMGFEKDPSATAETVSRVREAKPDVCLVALGSPKQEIWMYQYHQACGVPVMIGIGAGLDFVAGVAKRAPRWIQTAGFEWLWRMSREPRRLWRRYLIDDTLFFALFWRALRSKRALRSRRHGASS